jgi:hypothetical protein
MARQTISKIPHRGVAADSGYLSDLVDAAKRNNDAATAFFASSSSSHSVQVT